MEEALLENPTLEVVPDTETSDLTEMRRSCRRRLKKALRI